MGIVKAIARIIFKSSTDEKKIHVKDPIEVNKHIDQLAHEYFRNLHSIESAWKKLRENDFPAKQRDEFWQLCIQGRRLLWAWITAERRNNPNYYTPPNVPCYKRAVMLLEHEGQWEAAIDLCNQALEWTSSTWYSRKIEKYRAKVRQSG